MKQEFRIQLSNIIPKAEEMWDDQESGGRCVIGTGKDLILKRKKTKRES
jgi:hypothetical protein